MKTGATWDAEQQVRDEAATTLGLFTLKQWREAGLTDEQLKVRRRIGAIHRIFNRVYAFADAPRTPEFFVLAGTLRAGPIAAGYGATAAFKHGWMKFMDPVHIASTRRIDNRNPKYRFHRVALSRPEIVVVDGAPVTDHLRTMIDACGELHPKRLATIYQRAKRLEQFTDQAALARLEAEARQGRNGITNMRMLIGQNLGDFTRLMSDYEARFASFLDRWGFPPALRNVYIDSGRGFPWRPDFYWPSLPPPLVPVVSELHHYFTHGGPDEWHRDREKESDFELMGLRVITVSTKELEDELRLARRIGPHFGLDFSGAGNGTFQGG